MKDYSAMTDEQIAKEISTVEAIGKSSGKTSLECVQSKLVYRGGGDWSRFDPCNNPGDAWPIIKANLISLTPYGADGAFWEAEDRYGTGKSDCDNNPLRAAMIVYLMMREGDDTEKPDANSH